MKAPLVCGALAAGAGSSRVEDHARTNVARRRMPNRYRAGALAAPSSVRMALYSAYSSSSRFLAPRESA